MQRRSFLALFGCGVVALASDWSGALSGMVSTPPPTGLMAIEEIMLMGDRMRRPDMSRFIVRDTPMLAMGLSPNSLFRWVACPGEEIAFREQDHDVYLDGEQAHLIDWQFTWRLLSGCASVTGCEYCGRAHYTWPSGGHCLSCGGALPAPLTGGSRFLTRVQNGKRTVIPFEQLQPSDDSSCDYCGTQTVDGVCLSCGA